MQLAALCVAGSVAGHAIMMLQASGLQNKNHCSSEQILVSAACKIEREYMFWQTQKNKILVDDGQYMYAIPYTNYQSCALTIGCNTWQDALALCTHPHTKEKHTDTQQADAFISPVLCSSRGHQCHRPRKV